MHWSTGTGCTQRRAGELLGGCWREMRAGRGPGPDDRTI